MNLRAALVGKDLKRTVSPALHELLFQTLRPKLQTRFESITYEAISFETEQAVIRWMGEARSNGFTGANVTAPYKQTVTEAIRHQTREVHRIKSANTLQFQPAIAAITTDGAGLVHSLCRDQIKISGRPVVILGAGGAARAVLSAIRRLEPLSITVAVRDASRTAARIPYIAPEAVIVQLEQLARHSEPSIIIQATPVGQSEEETILEDFEWGAGDVAVDLTYNPATTTFLDRARSQGAIAVGGLGMLIEQGALSQEYWLSGKVGLDSPLTDDEYRAVHEKLISLLN